MSRVQLAIDVDDLHAAIAFHSGLFGTPPDGTPPDKVRPGYANFAVTEPPLELVLFERPGQGGIPNQLGVEVATPDEVTRARARLVAGGLATVAEDDVACCYARRDEVWGDGPSGEPWQVSAVLEDVEAPPGQPRGDRPAPSSACC